MDQDGTGFPPREEDEEKVGYKSPPKAHRFRKGQSGNPRGRPKASSSLEALVREELSKKVQVKTDGKPKWLSIAQALVIRTLHAGIAGDRRAADQGLRLMERYGLFDEPQAVESTCDLSVLTDEELKEYGRLLRKTLGMKEED